MIFEIEKADPIQGIIQIVVAKARPNGSGEADRDGDGLDPVYFERAFQGWVANFGREIDYFNPKTGAVERRFCGVYDTHKAAIKADLLGAWWFPDEGDGVGRMIVRPHDRRYAERAAQGRITSSWRGSTLAEEPVA